MALSPQSSTNPGRYLDPDSKVVLPPGDLYSEEPPLETYLHLQQLIRLLTSLEWHWRDRNDFFAAGNLTVYYSPRQSRAEDFRGPDFFVVLDTERYPRKSWMVWEEGGKYPNMVIEILSDSTADTDRGLKKQIYQDIWRTPEYFWFDPDDPNEFQGFQLSAGRYQPLQPTAQGWLWSQQLQLYLGVINDQLRFLSPQGNLISTPQEEAQQEQQRADREQQRADREQQRADRLAARLRELGIDPSTL